MRKEYMIPATEVAQVAATSLMQSASSAGDTMMQLNNIEGDQW